MISGLERRRNLRASGKGAERKAVGDSLRGDQDVGIDAEVFAGKHLSSAAETGLDFIGDEENVVLVKDLLDFFEIVWRWNQNAAFAHHRLCDECSHIAGSSKS